MDELLDAIVKEQLVDTLPQALKVWVTEREPSSSKEAGELADSYLQARGLERGGARQGERGERPQTDREQFYPRGGEREELEAEETPRKPQETGTEDTRGNRRRAEEEDQAVSGAIAVARWATSHGIALRKHFSATDTLRPGILAQAASSRAMPERVESWKPLQ